MKKYGVYPLTICKRLIIDLKESSLGFFGNQFNKICGKKLIFLSLLSLLVSNFGSLRGGL